MNDMKRTSTVALPETQEDLIRLVSRCVVLPRVSSIEITPQTVSVTRSLESEAERVIPQPSDDDAIEGKDIVLSSIDMIPVDDARDVGSVMCAVLNHIRQQDLFPAAFVVSTWEDGRLRQWSGAEQDTYFYGLPLLFDDSETVSAEKAVVIGSNTGLVADACVGYVIDMVL